MGDNYDELRTILAQPEVMPCDFDRTYDFWIRRISLWGKLKIEYTDNYGWFCPKRPITPEDLLNFLSEDNVQNFGEWYPEKLGYKSLIFKRGKERIWVDIDLKPEIKRGMKYSG